LSWIGWLNFEAVSMKAFSGFLMCGEFMVQSSKTFKPNMHLTRSCIQFFPSLSAPLHMVLMVPYSKTDPFRKGVAITITSTPGTCTCTISALKYLFEKSEQAPESPLFTKDDGTPLYHG